MKNKILIIVIASIFLSSSCSHKVIKLTEKEKTVQDIKKDRQKTNDNNKSNPIFKAESDASTAGKAVLETGRKMVFDEKAIIKGSCWDYINEVFKRAGYGTNKGIVYKSKKTGPYVDINKIQPGDWLYYINHSYGGVEHSGIFVYWKDYKNKIGVTLSYGGEHRNEPGRYREYDLKSVYYITRAGVK